VKVCPNWSQWLPKEIANLDEKQLIRRLPELQTFYVSCKVVANLNPFFFPLSPYLSYFSQYNNVLSYSSLVALE